MNQIAEIRTKTQLSDVRVDMFSTQGFALANRVAVAFASSDAVPAPFRSQNLKKINGQEQWVENPSAIGNCLVAIEVAQSVGMSVTAVMQNADVIEGKLRWNDRFVVAGVNASRRFTPLRFDVKNMGPVKASYKEKTGWDSQAKRPIFVDREVTVENLQSIAWALPYGFLVPPGIYTLDQAKSGGLPVIEGPPVSMRLAVEEGWYAKSGSKWQTELKHKMLMMRSGRYFGDIHAPDVVMGIGRTSDEEVDVIDVTPVESHPEPARRPTVSMPVEMSAEMPRDTSAPATTVDPDTGEVLHQQEQSQPAAEVTKPAPAMATPGGKNMIINRAKANGLDILELINRAGLGDMTPDLDGLTLDGWTALKDLLPKAQ
jgi:hypothetical protein